MPGFPPQRPKHLSRVLNAAGAWRMIRYSLTVVPIMRQKVTCSSVRLLSGVAARCTTVRVLMPTFDRQACARLVAFTPSSSLGQQICVYSV